MLSRVGIRELPPCEVVDGFGVDGLVAKMAWCGKGESVVIGRSDIGKVPDCYIRTG